MNDKMMLQREYIKHKAHNGLATCFGKWTHEYDFCAICSQNDECAQLKRLTLQRITEEQNKEERERMKTYQKRYTQGEVKDICNRILKATETAIIEAIGYPEAEEGEQEHNGDI